MEGFSLCVAKGRILTTLVKTEKSKSSKTHFNTKKPDILLSFFFIMFALLFFFLSFYISGLIYFSPFGALFSRWVQKIQVGKFVVCRVISE